MNPDAPSGDLTGLLDYNNNFLSSCRQIFDILYPKHKYFMFQVCIDIVSLLETFFLCVCISVCVFGEDFCYEKTIARSDLISVHLISATSPHLLSQTLLVSVVILS